MPCSAHACAIGDPHMNSIALMHARGRGCARAYLQRRMHAYAYAYIYAFSAPLNLNLINRDLVRSGSDQSHIDIIERCNAKLTYCTACIRFVYYIVSSRTCAIAFEYLVNLTDYWNTQRLRNRRHRCAAARSSIALTDTTISCKGISTHRRVNFTLFLLFLIQIQIHFTLRTPEYTHTPPHLHGSVLPPTPSAKRSSTSLQQQHFRAGCCCAFWLNRCSALVVVVVLVSRCSALAESPVSSRWCCSWQWNTRETRGWALAF